MKNLFYILLTALAAMYSCAGAKKIPEMGEVTAFNVDVEEISGLCLNHDKTALLSCGDQGVVKTITFEGAVSPVFACAADMEGITINPADGEIYMAIEGSQKVCRLNQDGLCDMFYVQEAVEGKYRNGGLEAVEYYKDDIVFVGSQKNANLWQYRLDGTMLSKVSLSGFATEIAGLCYDPVADRLWVTDSNEAKIFLCTTDGTLLATYSVPFIENLESICVDRERGCVWVASDEELPKLYRIAFCF